MLGWKCCINLALSLYIMIPLRSNIQGFKSSWLQARPPSVLLCWHPCKQSGIIPAKTNGESRVKSFFGVWMLCWKCCCQACIITLYYDSCEVQHPRFHNPLHCKHDPSSQYSKCLFATRIISSLSSRARTLRDRLFVKEEEPHWCWYSPWARIRVRRVVATIIRGHP